MEGSADHLRKLAAVLASTAAIELRALEDEEAVYRLMHSIEATLREWNARHGLSALAGR
jgi:hypothetical protein